MENSFSSLISSAASILVLLPTKPTFDQTAAGLALYLTLRDQKETSIVCPQPITVNFNRLIGVNKIVSELGNKNLTIKFAGYEATNIEKVSYDIDNGEFKLTVVPKTGFAAPQKEQLDLTYAGVSADLIVLIGGANDSHFPLLASAELSASKIVHIGTRSLSSTHDVMSLATAGATVSELIANLIKDNGLTLDADSATNLIMGIEEGSANFSSPEVRPETFETFAYLMRNGGQRIPKQKLEARNFPPGSIPTRPFNMPRPMPMQQPLVPQMPTEADAQDIEGTAEAEQNINPPDDWLQPKVFKGSSTPQMNNPDSFSENKG